jgi:diaminopimelate decarboxylase
VSAPGRSGLQRDVGGGAELGGVALEALFRGSGALPTPAYVYDLDGMRRSAADLDAAFGDHPHLVAYAVKANSAGPVVRALAAAGCGADVVSGGELAVALGAGIDPDRVVMSGVAKLDRELDQAVAAGSRGILAVQIESAEEVLRVAARARAAGRQTRVSLRVNPGVEVDTHAHVATGHDEAKFGVPLADVAAALEAVDAAPELILAGLSCHVGSQLMEPSSWLQAGERLCALVKDREARHAALTFVDLGGGFGVDYGGPPGASRVPVPPADFARGAVELLARFGLAGRTILVEPGRALVAPFGVLVARVVQAKRASSTEGGAARRWVMIDAGMNDLIRPALYQAKHRIEPIDAPAPADAGSFRVVGPVCESSDDFGAHPMPEPLPELVVVRDAGAYGFTMASEYNGRGLPTEVFLEQGQVAAVLRPRSAEDWAQERLHGARAAER